MTLAELLRQEHRPRLLVVGDLMLDRTTWAETDRISPEAPVPILRYGKTQCRLGGAGSVAAMAARLDAEVCLVSVVGADVAGRRLRGLLDRHRIDGQAVLCLPDRRTTVKSRFLGRASGRPPQQILRVDREESRPINGSEANRLLEAIWQRLDWADCLLLSDYGKGVCAGSFVPQLVAIARSAGVPVLADPARRADFRRYSGCACLLPNRLEASLALGVQITTVEEGLVAARRLLEFGVQSVAVKLDRDGIVWTDMPEGGQHFSTKSCCARDVTGAGDMVLAACGYAIASGADWPVAWELANLAAGLEVGRIGCTPIRRSELRSELAHTGHPEAGRSKILSLSRLLAELVEHRACGRRIVLTNGCFDLLHPGHLTTLEFARAQGDLLVVALNSDRSVQELKGPDRPILPEADRARMLAALACVDYVVLFDTASVRPVIEQIRPDCLVKGGKENVHSVVGRDLVESYGGRVLLAPAEPGYSTTALLQQTAGCRALGTPKGQS